MVANILEIEKLMVGYDVYGLRVVHYGSTHSVGDVLPCSYCWEDGEPTEDELYGTSAVEIDGSAYNTYRRLVKEYGSLGDTIVLIGGYQYVYGDDANEIVIKDGVVLSVLKM
jgi:hypothetical protein